MGQARAGHLLGDGHGPDFASPAGREQGPLDYIHRSTVDAEIYFLANRQDAWRRDVACTFRVAGRQPEIWDTCERNHA